MRGVAATSWQQGTANRIDLFWRDTNFMTAHVGWDGEWWSSNFVGPLHSVTPYDPDLLGGIFTTAPVAVHSLAAPPRVIEQARPVTDAGRTGGAAVSHLPVGVHPPIGTVKEHRLDVFGLGLDYALYHQVVWNGLVANPQPLTQWERLGGSLISAPAAVAWNDGHLDGRVDVFAVGQADRALYRTTWNTKSWSADWERLGGVFTSEASVVSWGPGRLDVFARGSDFTLRHRATDGTRWLTDWENLGESLASPPSAVAWGPDRLDVFAVRRSDGSLIHRWWDGSIWNDWESLAVADKPKVTFVAAPSAASTAPGRLDVFALGSDGVLYHFAYADGTWANPVARGSVLTSAPTPVALAGGELHLFGESRGAITGASWDGERWSGFSPLRTQVGPVAAETSLANRYRFQIWNVKADKIRARFEDTDVGNCSITPGNWPTRTATEAFGNVLDGGSYGPNELAFEDVFLELCEHVVFNYQVINKAGTAPPTDIVDTVVSLDTVADAAAKDAVASISKQLRAGVQYITSVELASLTVPVIGSILGLVAGWLIKEIGSILTAGYCDGAVAFEQYVASGLDLQRLTLKQTGNQRELHEFVTAHPGTESHGTCGPTSHYTVNWEVAKT